MECERCQAMLIDLVCDELASDAAIGTRQHLTQCANCRQAFEKLSKGMQLGRNLALIEPPPEARAALLARVEEHAARQAAAREVNPPPLWQPLLDFIGRLAMARQVGMVTLTLLIVAVGVWSLPQLKRVPGVPGSTVVSPDPEGEAAPSGVQVAERPASKEEGPAPRIRSAPEAKPAALRASARDRSRDAPPAPSAAKAPSAFPASPLPERRVERAGGGNRFGDDPSNSVLAAPAAESVAGSREQARPAAAKAASTSACSAAMMRRHEAVIAASASSREAGEALLALARCKRELGQSEQAQALLTRALRVPTAAPRARAMLAAPASAEAEAR